MLATGTHLSNPRTEAAVMRALDMARAPVGSELRNTDTGPDGHHVELVMTVTERTVAFCNENNQVVGFEYLNFRQARLGKRLPRPEKVHFRGW